MYRHPNSQSKSRAECDVVATSLLGIRDFKMPCGVSQSLRSEMSRREGHRIYSDIRDFQTVEQYEINCGCICQGKTRWRRIWIPKEPRAPTRLYSHQTGEFTSNPALKYPHTKKSPRRKLFGIHIPPREIPLNRLGWP